MQTCRGSNGSSRRRRAKQRTVQTGDSGGPWDLDDGQKRQGVSGSTGEEKTRRERRDDVFADSNGTRTTAAGAGRGRHGSRSSACVSIPLSSRAAAAGVDVVVGLWTADSVPLIVPRCACVVPGSPPPSARLEFARLVIRLRSAIVRLAGAQSRRRYSAQAIRDWLADQRLKLSPLDDSSSRSCR
jgi:hypothetical protein